MTALRVPPIDSEEHYWQAQPEGTTGRRRPAAGTELYSSAVPAGISDYCPSIPTDLEEASAALVRFDSYAVTVLGPNSSSLGPMSAVLLRTESTSSSQIENLTVGAHQLALTQVDQSSDNAKAVVANVGAMEAALKLAERLDEAALLTMQAMLVSAQPGGENTAGAYRDELIWVGTSKVSPIGVSHIPPQPELVKPCMTDLLRFIHRLDIPPLLHAAITHAQFETIHPYVDGNGRTGRALVHAMLRASGVVTTTTAPLSAGLLRDTESYFAALTAFREGDATPITEEFISASLFAASSGRQLVDDLAELLDQARERLRGLRRDAAAWTALPTLLAHPVITAPSLKRQLGLTDITTQRTLAQLVERGVLEERTGRKRNRIYQHSRILQTLDIYAEQLHQR